MSWDRWAEELHYSLHGGSLSVQLGHFIYDCKGARPYVSRPSRTQQLENPKLLAKLKLEGKPSVEVPEEFKNKYLSISCCGRVSHDLNCCSYRRGTANRILEAKEKERAKEQDKGEGTSGKRKRYVSFAVMSIGRCFLTPCPLSPALDLFPRLRQDQTATATLTLTQATPLHPDPRRTRTPLLQERSM